MDSALEVLGLEVNAEARTLVLANGVELRFRPPEGVDWQIARKRAEAAFAARDAFATAAARYGWTTGETVQLLDPERWDEASIFCVACELAPLVVSEIGRDVPVGDGRTERRTVPPVLEAFRVLFKQGDALDRFWLAAKSADRELIQPKKGPTSSPSTSSAAGANTAEGAGSSGRARTPRSSGRTARRK